MMATPGNGKATAVVDEQEPSGEVSQPLVPVDQQTLTFYDKPLVVVRLEDGRVGAVLRWFCDNLALDPSAQVRRIQRTEELVDDLVYVRVETVSGTQVMPTLILHAVPFWLAGIDSGRVRDEVRPEIRRYKREVVDVLYAWAQTQRISASAVVPSEPVVEPVRPTEDAELAEWRDYYLRMAEVIAWRIDVEQWRGTVEERLEGLEAVTDLIPEILERLGPQTITAQHQNQVKWLVSQLCEASGKHRGTIYSDLYTAFSVPKYQDLREDEWDQVTRWFALQMERVRKRGQP